MREILFRGKQKDNGEWVYGFPFAIHAGLVVEGIETLIGDRHRIDPSTVGQFTGCNACVLKPLCHNGDIDTIGDSSPYFWPDPEEGDGEDG